MYIEKSYPEFGIRKVSMAIGGSAGPTSIFLVGNKQKEKNLITRLESILRMKRHQHGPENAKRSIKPGTHTLDAFCTGTEGMD